MADKVLIIAEAGVNHNGSVETALRMVDAAAAAGADVIKFQTFQSASLAIAQAGLAPYQEGQGHNSQQEMLRALELDKTAHERLLRQCHRTGIRFLSSPFDEESVELLLELGVPLLKIPSGEVTNLPYLRRIGSAGVPVILSTGMCTLDEVDAAVRVLAKSGTHLGDITLLHCNTAYPTPFEDVNLRAMRAIEERFPQCTVGFSDHTPGIETATAAVALGARVIEKHFTLDRSMPGPDHKASLDVESLGRMIEAIRNVEAALGSGDKRPTASEQANVHIARKHVVAAKPISKGELFSETNLAVKRTGRPGLSPMLWDELMQQCASRSYRADEDIEI